MTQTSPPCPFSPEWRLAPKPFLSRDSPPCQNLTNSRQNFDTMSVRRSSLPTLYLPLRFLLNPLPLTGCLSAPCVRYSLQRHDWLHWSISPCGESPGSLVNIFTPSDVVSVIGIHSRYHPGRSRPRKLGCCCSREKKSCTILSTGVAARLMYVALWGVDSRKYIKKGLSPAYHYA
ncbi:hypothetical protein GQ43DRAFT_56944 [Delitschia confertaspora ATCC 74209]|uniref:Uncharacterized protein n=1 Tax=Delitschia confertaspora ATCC 74209 TaxID=1513339 RepID=A0A9P4JK19_9PLEO|nr:hypothetical protein GQ43DRAFT_56944 [Delitschia confertaspora ATCC 74209]